MSVKDKGDYLAVHGRKLVENGYDIIPIPPKSKSPGFDGWQKVRSTRGMVAEWLESGMSNFGIGILSRNTPAIDIDCTDEKVVRKITEYCELKYGNLLVRVGRAPKCILLFTTDEPFRKMKTGKFEDEWGDKHEVEILGDGQQFVGFGLHKDTGKPYAWLDGKSPANTPVETLPKLTLDEATDILEYAEKVMLEEGFTKKGGGMSGGVRTSAEDDPFADVESKVDLPTSELSERLMLIGRNDDYERWVQIGMALYHQYDGDDEGLQLWHEWSETADNYDHDALESKWQSLAIEGKRRAPITARLILKLAKEECTTAAINRVAELREGFYAAKDVFEWREICTKVRQAEIDSVARAEIAEIARKRYQDMSGVKLSIVEVRKSIAYELTANVKTPEWCKNWVFDAAEDRFFHVLTKITMTMQGFNAVFSRKALTKKDILEGRTAPSASPVDLALNIYKIPEVYGTAYAPGEDYVFGRNGFKVANTYPEYQVPAVPEKYTPKDKRAIRIVMAHLEHLLPEPSERRLFLNWLAFIVQNPGKRVNWAMVLQGVEGDGKSFWAFLLRAVMGVSNVRMINANVLEGNFTGWAHGQCVVVVEEPRLQGHNKYDVLNKIKPLITNAVIEIHPKGKDPYNVENTSNYYLPTNFRDALPLNDNDRRYCVLFSRWQNRDELREFNEKNPTYYVELYRTLEDCAPALRKHLIEHEIDDDFPAGGDAPRTTAHRYMVTSAKPEPIRAIQEIIDENEHADICEELINATALPDAMIGRDADLPQTQGLNRLLEHNGYVFLGRVRIDGVLSRFWSKYPDKFRSTNNIDTRAVRNFIEKRKKIIKDSEL